MAREIPRHALAELVDWLDRHAPSAIEDWRSMRGCESREDEQAATGCQLDLGATIAAALDDAERAGLLNARRAA